MLDNLRRAIVAYYCNEVSPRNGLISDKSQPGSASSIAAVGMGLSVYIVAVKRGVISRAEGVNRTLTLLRFLHSSHQSPEPDATGYKGFYYHFLDIQTGRRAFQCEVSTIDTAILMARVLTVASYFTAESLEESEIRKLAEILYQRVDWQWALDKGTTISHGWMPESGFLPYRWDKGYNEALILYALALGSPTFPIHPQGYKEWISTFEWKKVYDIEYLYAGPLFIHQMSHLWVVNGVRRTFFGYESRGAPFGPDDGTISPWAVATSLPFAPEIVIETIRHIIEVLESRGHSPYGFVASFNPTCPDSNANQGAWTSPWIFGSNEGPILMMNENYIFAHYNEYFWGLTASDGPGPAALSHGAYLEAYSAMPLHRGRPSARRIP